MAEEKPLTLDQQLIAEGFRVITTNLNEELMAQIIRGEEFEAVFSERGLKRFEFRILPAYIALGTDPQDKMYDMDRCMHRVYVREKTKQEHQ